MNQFAPIRRFLDYIFKQFARKATTTRKNSLRNLTNVFVRGNFKYPTTKN